MAALGQYILSVAGAALVCGILCGILKDTGTQGIVKLVCGVFLTLTALRPVADISFVEISRFALPYQAEAAEAALAGEDYARDTLCEIIKADTQAYILDKAAELGADVSVRVSVSQDPIPVPVSVQITGSLSPYNKQKLEQIIERDLNIAKENQIWIG